VASVSEPPNAVISATGTAHAKSLLCRYERLLVRLRIRAHGVRQTKKKKVSVGYRSALIITKKVKNSSPGAVHGPGAIMLTSNRQPGTTIISRFHIYQYLC
jgi:hypothetical protein